jgi:hypothetical protein
MIEYLPSMCKALGSILVTHTHTPGICGARNILMGIFENVICHIPYEAKPTDAEQ